MSTPPQPWTVGRLIDWTRRYFQDHQVDAPRLAAELLLAHALGCTKIELYTRYDHEPAAPQLAQFRAAVRRAASHHPIAYLVGEKEFYSLRLEVSPAVLIPRPETEVLVDRVRECCSELAAARLDILDLGTGSGCIGLALCRHLPQAYVVGTDVSRDALEVASRNADHLALRERFTAVHADGMDLPAAALPPGGFDLLVSNPPYVAAADPRGLEPAVRDHEPQLALFGGPDGLDFYRRIAADAPAILRPGASVFVEIGYDQHDQVVATMAAGRLVHVASWRDLNERHWRVLRFDWAA